MLVPMVLFPAACPCDSAAYLFSLPCRRNPPSEGMKWLCRIKLKREYDVRGIKLAEIPPEELFCTITRKEDITLCVTAAQAVLLNPGFVDMTKGKAAAFVPLNLAGDGSPSPRHSDSFNSIPISESGHQLEFISNSVVLEIEGADADLTIVDLPGIIQAHPKVELPRINLYTLVLFHACP